MIDGIPNRPLYFYQKDIIVWEFAKPPLLFCQAARCHDDRRNPEQG